MKENRELIETTRMKVKKMVESHSSKTSVDIDHVKNRIRDEVGQFLFGKTQRRPMVLPVVIKV
jgi:ribonuclease J